MEKLKVMTIIGTRPEIIRLSECMKACDKFFDHIVVHTGQNWDYTLNKVFFKELNLREPDYYLNTVGSNLGETIGKSITSNLSPLTAYSISLSESTFLKRITPFPLTTKNFSFFV